MSDLLRHAQSIYKTLPQHKLAEGIFRREPGKYYTLINYPPLRGMAEHNDNQFSFIKPSSNSKRLYIHVPFCSGHCTFCNYKIILGAPEHWTYLKYIVKELDILVEDYFGELEIDNILFGGGTPSLLSLKELEYLYTNVLSRIKLRTPYLGFEIHPEMVNDPECEAKLKLLKEVGVDRINIGVQTFDDAVLKAVNRRHTASDNLKIIEMCQKAGFNYINFDLILGLPRQTLQSWEDTIKTTLDFQPSSISPFYCWMKSSMPIFSHFQRRPEDFPSREEVLLMIIMYMEDFTRHGYDFGTIDYYFKPNKNNHNNNETSTLDFYNFLHTDFEVLALGISGYGLINNTRYINHIELPDYYEAIDKRQLSVYRYYGLPVDDIIRLNLMYSLRYDNVNLEEFRRRYGIELTEYFGKTLTHLQDIGLLEISNAQIKLTYLGKIYSDEICMFFVSDNIKQKIREDESKNSASAKKLDAYNYMYDITHL